MEIRHAKVLFPTCGPEARMNRVRVTAYPERHNGKRICPYANKVQQIKHLLGYCRDEEGIETIDIDVVVRFDDDAFEGQSLGLALALADKRARFLSRESTAAICATGVISSEGRVQAVDYFSQKVAHACDSLVPGTIFVYPLGNKASDPEGLRKLEAQGVQVIGADSLDELSALWEEQGASASSIAIRAATNSRTAWVWLILGTAIGFLTTIGVAFVWISVHVL